LAEKGRKPRLEYICYWKGCSKQEREIAGRPDCHLKAVDSERIDREIFLKIIEMLTNPSAFAKTWLRDLNADEISERLIDLEKQEGLLNHRVLEGFRYISSETNPDLRLKYQVEQNKTADQWKALHSTLEKTREEYNAATSKIDRYQEFCKAMEKKDRRGKMHISFKQKGKFKELLFNLPFAEKRRLIEAIISPENGGKVFVTYLRPADFLSDEELESIPKDQWHESLTDRSPICFGEFQIDVSRIEAIINSLDRSEILKKGHHNRTAL